MNIGIVGLGLIGGSFARAIKAKTTHTVWGLDINETSVLKALDCGAIDERLTSDTLSSCDMVMVCLYPYKTVEFIKENAGNFKKGSIVVDVCGVKRYIKEQVRDTLLQNDVKFIAAHPMAGREVAGFESSLATLYENASYIIADKDADENSVQILSKLATDIGFANIVVTSEDEHDEVIAYTSQMAHVLSNAYVKSPSYKKHKGFSAGSFADLSRVAKLDANMWSDLFLLNRDNLLNEIDCYLKHLMEYKVALETENRDELYKILKDGNDIKVGLK